MTAFSLGFSRDAFRGWWTFLKISVPSFFLLATEAWSWTLQDFLAGFISTKAMAANAIAPQIALVQYAIGGSISIAATTVIGNSLGEQRANQARRAARISILLVPLCWIPSTILVFALRRPLPRIFSQDAVVVQMVEDLLLITQVFSIFDNHQAALTGILTGARKQAVAAPLIVICYWIVGVPTGIVLAFGFLGSPALGLHGLWYGMTIAVALHMCSFAVVVWRIDWERAVSDAEETKLAGKIGGDLLSDLTQDCRGG